jgi:hypothetical protein
VGKQAREQRNSFDKNLFFLELNELRGDAFLWCGALVSGVLDVWNIKISYFFL